jgi:hypothetical protein
MSKQEQQRLEQERLEQEQQRLKEESLVQECKKKINRCFYTFF